MPHNSLILKAYHPRAAAGLWLAMMLVIVFVGSRILTKDWLETGFLALLPASEQQPEIADAIGQHNEQRDRKLIWLVGAESSGAAIKLAKQIKLQLEQSQLFRTIMLEVPQQLLAQRFQQLFPYRYQLLAANTQAMLLQNPKDLLNQNLQIIYSPMAQVKAAGLEHDPLLLFSRYIDTQNPVKLTLDQGIIIVQDLNKVWVLLLTELADSQLQLDKLEALQALVSAASKQAQSAAGEMMVTGMPLFTAAGAESAKQEISTVGLGSSIGILLLMVLTFRSLRPLSLSFLAIGSGLVAALVVSVLVFGKIHIISLVFGASLIGVADDYALHFMCDSFWEKNWQPRNSLRYLLPGLLIGLLVNLLSYSGLVLSPFPALQEVALFSAVGLLVAWLSVVLLFPLLLKGFKSEHLPSLLTASDYWQQQWPLWLLRNQRWLIPLLLMVIVGGLWQLSPRDDVRLLQSAPTELLKTADKIKGLLPLSPENQFFLVTGNGVSDWHQNEQRLLAQLKILASQNKLSAYQGLSDYWPDEKVQQSNYGFLDKTLYQPGLVQQYMKGLSFSDTAIKSELQQFTEGKARTISLPDWIATANESQKNLWLGCNPKSCRSIVSLVGIKDLSALSSLQNLTGVSWVDQVGQLSSVFARYRVQVSLLLAATYLLVLIGLGLKFGWRNALVITAIPIVSALVSLAMIGWFNQLFSLFNLFALLLVLGIGVDDAVFFFMADEARQQKKSGETETENRRSSTSLAVTLSALTTLLAFGLLAVSTTEIVHAFGFTVATGIFTAFLCSPLVGYRKA